VEDLGLKLNLTELGGKGPGAEGGEMATKQKEGLLLMLFRILSSRYIESARIVHNFNLKVSCSEVLYVKNR